MKIHGGAYQMAGVPDIMFVREGRPFFLEVKVPGKTPSMIQEVVMERLRHAGASVSVVTSVEAACLACSLGD